MSEPEKCPRCRVGTLEASVCTVTGGNRSHICARCSYCEACDALPTDQPPPSVPTGIPAPPPPTSAEKCLRCSNAWFLRDGVCGAIGTEPLRATRWCIFCGYCSACDASHEQPPAAPRTPIGTVEDVESSGLVKVRMDPPLLHFAGVDCGSRRNRACAPTAAEVTCPGCRALLDGDGACGIKPKGAGRVADPHNPGLYYRPQVACPHCFAVMLSGTPHACATYGAPLTEADLLASEWEKQPDGRYAHMDLFYWPFGMKVREALNIERFARRRACASNVTAVGFKSPPLSPEESQELVRQADALQGKRPSLDPADLPPDVRERFERGIREVNSQPLVVVPVHGPDPATYTGEPPAAPACPHVAAGEPRCNACYAGETR